MGLRDEAINALRRVFGRKRDEIDKALSPSLEAERNLPSSLTSMWGRDDIGGLLTLSQNLMDRYADAESMKEYPDIACFAGDSIVYTTDGSMVKPVTIESLAFDDAAVSILVYDRESCRITKAPAIAPRLTGINQTIYKIPLSNGSKLRVTKDHKILHREKGYVNAETLQPGDEVVSMYPGFNVNSMSFLMHHRCGYTTVLAAPEEDGTSRVFDVTTETHNLIVNGVVCHNSAFFYFANDSTQPDIDTGRTIWVTSQDESTKNAADILIKKKLRLEEELFPIAYELSCYGNSFSEVLINENGVVALNALPPPTVRRIERADGALIGYIQDVTGKFTEDTKNMKAALAGKGVVPEHVAMFEDWQVIHMRLRGTERKSTYGRGIGDNARWIWKRLVLLEDAVMIHRLLRSPSRFVYTVDVTDVPPDKVDSFLRKTKMEINKKPLVNPTKNQLDLRFNPLSNDENVLLASRDGKPLATVQTLQGPIYSHMEDINYFKRMLHGCLMVPRNYLGQEGAIPQKSILSSEDVRAAKTTLTIQKEIKLGIEQLILIDKAARQKNPYEVDFTVHMTVPSGIYELAQMELRNARADFASRVMPHMSQEWVRRFVFKLSDEEIAALDKQTDKEFKIQLDRQMQQMKAQAEIQQSMAMQQQQLAMQQQSELQGNAPPGSTPDGPMPLMPGNDLPRTALEMKIIDNQKRIEEKRRKETDSRLAELEDKYNDLLVTDRAFAKKLAERQDFIQEVKDAALYKSNGVIHAVPSHNGHSNGIPRYEL